ncbi:MAG: PaaX family transcriptional regulator C-terminal domain-containing protein [Alcanivoracaceae bacterium]
MKQEGAPNARRIIMGLLLAEGDQPLSSRQVVAACDLFGISENSARVALARLSASGLIASAERGSYQLGEAATALAGDVATWREAESRLGGWSGHYIAVLTGALGRTDRTALRRRERVLDMLGFRELDKDCFVRPDNLAGGVEAVRPRLYALGLESEAPVFLASGFDHTRTTRLPTLWDGAALNQLYQRQHEALNRWLDNADQLEPEDAARESFLLGGRAIRHIVFDPLLPAPLVDADARHAFIQTVKQFDRAGYAIWQRLYQLKNAQTHGSEAFTANRPATLQ